MNPALGQSVKGSRRKGKSAVSCAGSFRSGLSTVAKRAIDTLRLKTRMETSTFFIAATLRMLATAPVPAGTTPKKIVSMNVFGAMMQGIELN